MQLLASILVMIALYSINLRLMGKSNVALIDEPTVSSAQAIDGVPEYWMKPLALLMPRACQLQKTFNPPPPFPLCWWIERDARSSVRSGGIKSVYGARWDGAASLTDAP